MSRFHAPEDSVTEQSVRMAHNCEYMVPVEVSWQLERALNKAREECHRLYGERQAMESTFNELHGVIVGGGQ